MRASGISPPPPPPPPALSSSSPPQAASRPPPTPAAAAPCRKPRRDSPSLLRCCPFMVPPGCPLLAMGRDGPRAPSRKGVVEHPADALRLRRAHVSGGLGHDPPGRLVQAGGGAARRGPAGPRPPGPGG